MKRNALQALGVVALLLFVPLIAISPFLFETYLPPISPLVKSVWCTIIFSFLGAFSFAFALAGTLNRFYLKHHSASAAMPPSIKTENRLFLLSYVIGYFVFAPCFYILFFLHIISLPVAILIVILFLYFRDEKYLYI